MHESLRRAAVLSLIGLLLAGLTACMLAVPAVTHTDVTPAAVVTAGDVSAGRESRPSSQPESEPVSSADATSAPEEASSQAASSAAESHAAVSRVTSRVTSSQAPAPVVVPHEYDAKLVHYLTRPTYASVQSDIAVLQQTFPDLITVESIGTSAQGRDLTMLKVGKGVSKACIIAGIHAREFLTVSYLLRCIEEFCRAYETESGRYADIYDMDNLLSVYTLYIVPLSNPDGLEIVSGRAQPSVTVTYKEDKTLADYKANANGVNLNRNFPMRWDDVDTEVYAPDPEKYKGPEAASEPETRALMALCEANDFMWMTSIHVRGDCLYWSDEVNPSVGTSSTVATQLETRCDFYKCPTSDDVDGYGGGFENWFRQQYKRPGFCLELMPLTEHISATSDANNRNFDLTTRWASTKAALPVIMIYGFAR